jgi:hypothetical protein
MTQSDRYEEIMRRLAQRKAEQEAAPKREAQDDLARILDDLDVMGKLEKLRGAPTMKRLCWGPKVRKGLSPLTWVSAILWRRGSGYHGYKQLQIIGVWAYEDSGVPMVTVATKHLAYSAPTYEAEAYHKLIRKNFDLYYHDDGAPPAANRLYTVRYDPAQRLAIREEVKNALTAWAANT